MSPAPRRILVHRLGSLGDTAIMIPFFRMLNRAFPDAEKRVMTNFPVADVAAPLQAVLGDEAFATGYFAYPVGTRDAGKLWRFAREVREWGPDLAVYANAVRPYAHTLRDGFFLRLCGARRIAGLPLSRAFRAHGHDPATGLWEREASRIARAAAALGEVRLDDPAERDLALTAVELAEAERLLAGWEGAGRFMSFSPGTKQPHKDWTDPNWRAAFAALTAAEPGLGLLALGAPEDRERSDALLAAWRGPALNVCGEAPPRISAALIGRSLLFLGNDSGPMHLAAAAGAPAVAVFSRHARPGIWFPLGEEHRVFYPGLAWSGGKPAVLRDAGGETDITTIPAGQVAEACLGVLKQRERDA